VLPGGTRLFIAVCDKVDCDWGITNCRRLAKQAARDWLQTYLHKREQFEMVEKTIVLTGISANSIEDAVQLAITRASVTLTGIHSARITNVEAVIEDKRVARWKVIINCTFRVSDPLHE
jgi:dodecin